MVAPQRHGVGTVAVLEAGADVVLARHFKVLVSVARVAARLVVVHPARVIEEDLWQVAVEAEAAGTVGWWPGYSWGGRLGDCWGYQRHHCSERYIS